MKPKFQFSIADLMLLTAAIGIYIGMFQLSWDAEHKLGQSLMIAGGSVLFLGKIFQVLLGRSFRFYYLTERHSKLWLGAAIIGMLAIVMKV